MKTQLRFVAPIPVALAALLFPLQSASAQECQEDADCGANAVCEIAVSEICSGIACPEGSDCPMVEPTCETTEYRYCMALSCTGDADCGDGKVCAPFTEQTCDGGAAAPACDPNTNCEPVTYVEPTCTETTTQYCVYKHELPCTTSGDCGEGFLCKQAEMCGCSGSAGAAEGDAFAPPPPECFCEPSGEFYCQAVDIACAADTDCPADWTCAPSWVGGGCTAPADGSEPICTTESGPAICHPPYSSSGGPVYAEGGSTSGTGGATSGTDLPRDDASGVPGGEPAPTDPNSADPGTVEEGGEGSNEPEASGGCSVSRTGGTSDAGLLSLLAGLVLLGRRLRRS